MIEWRRLYLKPAGSLPGGGGDFIDRMAAQVEAESLRVETRRQAPGARTRHE